MVALRHREGQYRAELFEELVHRILVAKYPHAKISQDCLTFIFGKSRRVDFLIEAPRCIFVESRAPYSQTPWKGVMRSIRLLQDLTINGNGDAILALAGPIPAEGVSDLETIYAEFRARSVAFEIWDEGKILDDVFLLLGRRLASLSIDDLLTLVGDAEESLLRRRSFHRGPVAAALPARSALPEGRSPGAIILIADFCSFSKFVHASRGDDELVSSVMGRLYRESRKLIQQHGGVLDKFMGDGLLAYWLPGTPNAPGFAAQFLECAKSLTGMAIKLADEWQEQVDLAVEPTGLRCGAAMGDVLFIAEDPHGGVLVHAIGEEINIAARLQGEAEPNVMALSNRLRNSYFGNDATCTEFAADLKNIGRVIAWKKALA